jgi:hypothetical protein
MQSIIGKKYYFRTYDCRNELLTIKDVIIDGSHIYLKTEEKEHNIPYETFQSLISSYDIYPVEEAEFMERLRQLRVITCEMAQDDLAVWSFTDLPHSTLNNNYYKVVRKVQRSYCETVIRVKLE